MMNLVKKIAKDLQKHAFRRKKAHATETQAEVKRMQQFVTAILVITVGGLLAWLTGRLKSLSVVIGTGSCVGGGLLALIPATEILMSGGQAAEIVLNLPLGAATMKLDAVSAFFSLPVIVLGSLAAVYAAATSHYDKHECGGYWFFYCLLMASMLFLTASANAVLFLMAWEIMSVAAFFLIIHRDEIASARNAAWRFLVASHVGTAGLFIMFAIISAHCGSFEFACFTRTPVSAETASLVFFLALFGFGVKVGLLPLHVWMPDSYAFADAHVSAVLSGAMSKMGFYGLIRVLMFLPVHSASWGWALAFGGLLTGVFALITALAQHDLKKVIAYSSMENAGIIMMGLGCAILAGIWKVPALAFAALTGSLLHVLNHAACKGLLFLGSGAAYFGTGTRKLEAMGGLAKTMPYTAMFFGIGAAAISGLPPFNSFISEFMIFLAGLQAARLGTSSALLLAGVILAGLGLIGGLAMATFSRTFGLVFLGASRSDKKVEPRESDWLVRLPMAILVLVIFLLALLSPFILIPVARVASMIAAASGVTFTPENAMLNIQPVTIAATISFFFMLFVVLVWRLRSRFFSGGDVNDRCTWDCGFAAPDARIQYTSSSFSQPVSEVFSSIVRPYRHGEKVAGFFPERASFRTDAPDSLLRYLYVPLFGLIDRAMVPLRALQHGRLHLYICYLAIVLLALLIWKVVAA